MAQTEHPVTQEILPEHYFHTYDKQVLRSIQELLVYARTCNDESFHHHVTATRNDFGNWIRDVFHEELLAQKLFVTTDRRATLVALETYILHMQSVRIHGGTISPSLPDISHIHLYTDDELQRFSQFTTHAKNTAKDESDALPAPTHEKLLLLYRELSARVHDLRKHGKNPIIPDMYLRSAKVKMDYAAITKHVEDYEKIAKILKDAEEEIAYCAQEKIVDVKAELRAQIQGISPSE